MVIYGRLLTTAVLLYPLTPFAPVFHAWLFLNNGLIDWRPPVDTLAFSFSTMDRGQNLASALMVDTMSRVPDYYCMTFDEADEDDVPGTSQVDIGLCQTRIP